MSRKQRRAEARAGRLDPRVQSYAEGYECPTCTITGTVVTRDAWGILHLHVFHDSTCPRLKGLTS